MLDNINRLDLSAKDIELIENALHTQRKILSMQTQAGGIGASEKLAELKQLLRRIGKARPARRRPEGWTYSNWLRNLFSARGRCSQCS